MSDSDSGSNASMDEIPPYLGGLESFDGAGEQFTSEEHLWIGNLSEECPVIKFEGCDDAESTLILRRATIAAECEDEGRHVVQIISLDHDDKRITGSLCSLKLDGNCSVSLDAICCSPPTAFKLIKGTGPITISGNLCKEVDPTLLQDNDDEGDSEEEEAEQKIMEVEGGSSSEEEVVKAEVPIQKNGMGPDGDKKKGSKKDKQQKRKNEEDDGNDAKKPKMNGVKKEKKSDGDKPERKPITSAAELIDAINTNKGGRPKKREKFENWVKHTFKCDNKAFTDKAWKACNV